MPRIYLCFLWHMHQPFYKDLISGEYKLPWTRLHALKDYYGMVRILEEFPRIRQTFNLVPSMMVQVGEYAAGVANDPYLDLALKPAENLTEAERDFIWANFFHAEPSRMIYRYPRYGELYEVHETQKGSPRGRHLFSAQDMRDLQVLSQLAWFDEYFQADDPEVAALIARGRDFSLDDQRLMGEKQKEIIGEVVPAYQRLAASGQIEISTTPYYHPILPLVCDSEIARVSHPNVPLPPRFRYPGDARVQLERARQYVARQFGVAPVGLWPSEGSVSDEALAIAAENGFRWAATDSGVLARTLGKAVGVDSIYRPYRWSQNDQELNVLFRDHLLSDLIGFVYSRMNAAEAAADFLNRIRENCRGILQGGRDALVPIILDGENAWEYYDRNGRPFLRELYGRISQDEQMVATTIADALKRIEPEGIGHIFPGSWINTNFDVWIGAEEDNQAWTYLSRAREAYDAVAASAPEKDREIAYEELLISEGSDWCWWYGPEHESANRVEFDQLYRSHLANVYRALHEPPPEELSRPILRLKVMEFHLGPSGPIHPAIDGEISSYFEWLGAGLYRIDQRSGSMHGKKSLVQELHYGSDGSNVYLRVDFNTAPGLDVEGAEARIHVQSGDPPRSGSATIRLEGGKAQLAAPDPAFECAYRKILEMRISLATLGIRSGEPVRLELSLWKNGLPLDAIPQSGWLELNTDPQSWERF